MTYLIRPYLMISEIPLASSRLGSVERVSLSIRTTCGGMGVSERGRSEHGCWGGGRSARRRGGRHQSMKRAGRGQLRRERVAVHQEDLR